MNFSDEMYTMKQLHKNHNRQHSTTALHFENESKPSNKLKSTPKTIFTSKNMKITVLTLIWLTTLIIFIIKPERKLNFIHLDVPPTTDKIFSLNQNSKNARLDVHLLGAFSRVASNSKNSLQLYAATKNGNQLQQISENFSFHLVDEELLETSAPETLSAVLTLSGTNKTTELFLVLNTNCNFTFTLSISYELKPFSVTVGICIGACILIGLYSLIIFEIVDRAFAAIIAANLSLAALAIFNERPHIEEIMTWIDVDTLLLLFGMMILVSVTAETGIFDYMAVLVYKKTKGSIWKLIWSLCIITILSALLIDSVSTILLMTPMVIRICEVSNLNPIPILMILIIAVNIGSLPSPIGDPPNIMVINDPYIKSTNLNFLDFVLHTLPGVIIIVIQTYVQLRYLIYRNTKDFYNKERYGISNIKHEIVLCEKDARTVSCISKFDDLHRHIISSKINLLKEALEREMENESDEEKTQIPDDFETMYTIKNVPLLIQCCITFAIVILLLFLHSVPYFEHISIGWAALLGVVLLLIITNNEDFKACLLMVEWSSLLFFAALFVLMEALTKIGLITFIGEQLSDIIKLAPIKSRIAVAVTLVLWVSSIISAFLDNIPLVSMMIKVIVTLSSTLNLNIQPLVWALVFGCGIGGNGTLIASSANLVCVGLAEQHGYKFTFLGFFKIGFPIMIVNTVIVNIYLIICHVAFEWH